MTAELELRDFLRQVKEQIEAIKRDVNTHWEQADSFDTLDSLGQNAIDKVVDAQITVLQCYDKMVSDEPTEEIKSGIRASAEGALTTALRGCCDFFKGVCEDLDRRASDLLSTPTVGSLEDANELYEQVQEDWKKANGLYERDSIEAIDQYKDTIRRLQEVIRKAKAVIAGNLWPTRWHRSRGLVQWVAIAVSLLLGGGSLALQLWGRADVSERIEKLEDAVSSLARA